ncbi:TAF5-like RNA polymerase II p300/CBP-associated factor-associated factor 65 kDa subunit 5L [Tubulanus polymorphus]|uniref:TAF5-like RNA polymerase II p300/CBP-associated factor-associated factor 65 kDa subunit 5L n=1 Tax=Tubulanus polymorphus TaxID=672921 RepID=UPI003DA57898
MKRIRRDHIQTTINQYLKRRHFTTYHPDPHDTPPQFKQDMKILHTLGETTLYSMSKAEGGASNLFSYSSISGDVTACDQQFTRLKRFILSDLHVCPYQKELKELFYPLFVHIYLELICNGFKTPAHKFYTRHHGIFDDQKEKSKFLELLKEISSKDDIEKRSAVQCFREHKFTVNISTDAIQFLLRQLKNGDNMVILQMLNQYIHVKDVGVCSDELQSDTKNDTPQTSPPLPPENKVITNDVSMTSLRKCIQRVHETPPCLTSICFYTFINTYQGLSCSNVSNDRRYLCGGFEDSNIRLWSLTPDLLTVDNAEIDVSKIHLSEDFVEEPEKTSKVCEMVTLQGHSGAVYSSQFIGDNRYIVSCSDDTTIRLWDLKNRTNKVCYQGHTYPVWGLDTGNLGYYFASCSADRTAKLWSTDCIYPLRSFIGHTSDVDCIKFHPNGNYIATGSSDSTIRLWTVNDARSVRLFKGHHAGIYCLAFSPNGKYLASAGEDRHIKLWELGTGKLLKELRGHTECVHSLSFNRDTTLLASGGLDCSVRVWDISSTNNNHNSHMAEKSDISTSAELLGAFPTKSTSVQYLQYTKNNLLLAAGGITS